MKTFKLALVLFSFSIFIGACNTGAPANSNAGAGPTPATSPTVAAKTSPTPADEMASARTTFAAECARCHGTAGDGGTVEVLKKKLKVPSLKKGHALSHSDAELVRTISEGHEEMPSFKDKLKQEEINSLVRLIRKEFQGK